GVYYRGEGCLVKGRCTIGLPEYFEKLVRAEQRTVILTAKTDGEQRVSGLAATAVTNGAFTVIGTDDRNPSQAFFWEVKGVRADVDELEVERPRSAITFARPDALGATSSHGVTSHLDDDTVSNDISAGAKGSVCE